MPVEKPRPRSLAAWLKELSELPLPLPAEEREPLLRTIRDSRRSLREIAERIYHCPAATLCLIRAANRSRNSLVEPSVGIEQALSRLGLERSEELIRQMPGIPSAEYPQGLAQLLLISQHASQQAKGLFAARLARLWEEIHCGSLLLLSPIWLLIYSRPELFKAWEQRVLINNEPPARVEIELLGVPLLELALALAEKLRLPEWIIQGYRLLVGDRRLLVKALHIARDHEHPLQQQLQLDQDPPLRRWLTRTENSILLANCIAMAAHHDWNGNHCRRWQRLTGLSLKLPVDDMRQITHQQAVISAREHASAALWHPAQALLWPWDCYRWQPVVIAPPAVQLTAIDQWRESCAQLLRDPSAFTNVLQLTACAIQAIQQCGMQRVLLLLADRQHTRLVAQQCYGLPNEAARLSIDPAQSQIIRRLLAQPGQLHLSPSNMAQFSALLPGNLKSVFSGEHLVMRSLVNNQRVVMLLIADQGGGGLSDSSLKGFSKTAQCIERALTSFSRRGR